MARAVWKGPFVEESLIKKVEKQQNQTNRKPIKTWSRKSTIIPEFVGFSFLIHNGRKFIPLTISEDMVGHKLGEFAPTRTFAGHTPEDKKAAKVATESVKNTTNIKRDRPMANRRFIPLSYSQHPTKTVSFSAIVNPQIVFTRALTRLFQLSDFIIYSCRDVVN